MSTMGPMEVRAFISVFMAGILISVAILTYPYSTDDEEKSGIQFDITSWWGTVDGSPMYVNPALLMTNNLSHGEFEDVMFIDNESFETSADHGSFTYQMYRFKSVSSAGTVGVQWIGNSADWGPDERVHMYVWNWWDLEWSRFPEYQNMTSEQDRVVHYPRRDPNNMTLENVDETQVTGWMSSDSESFLNDGRMFVLVTTYDTNGGSQSGLQNVDTDCIGIIAPVNHLEPVASTAIDWGLPRSLIHCDGSDSVTSGPRIIGYSWELREDDGYRNYSWVTYEEGIDISVVQRSFLDLNVTLTVRDEHGSLARVTRNVDLSRIDKPAIYLYPANPRTETVRVTIAEGEATITIPEVPLGPTIEWEDVRVDNGTLVYEGIEYDYLFYEAVTLREVASDQGWLLELVGEDILLDGRQMTYDDLQELFRSELEESGLYEHEIDDWIEFWLGPDRKVFLGRSSGLFAVTYIPPEQIEGILTIETMHHYDEVLRVFFSIEIVDDHIPVLTEPVYDTPAPGSDILHEWGVFEQEVFRLSEA